MYVHTTSAWVDTLRALYVKLTPELKKIQISPIQEHAYIMKYPQDWFHYLGKVRVRARPVECF